MKHFTHLADLSIEGMTSVLNQAAQWKHDPPAGIFNDRVLGMLFFNPSLRTRVSFETAMLRGGGHAVVLDVGNGVWQLEDRLGIMMDGTAPEHIQEAIPVLARYVDGLAVRTFAANKDPDADEQDSLLRQIRQYSTVPVISMESAREHPCQGLADLLTIREKLGATAGRPVTLSWAPHIKPLPQAVPNSFLLTAAACGCNITVAHPPGFELHPQVISEAGRYATATGARLSFSHDQQDACHRAEVVYAKSWAPADPTATELYSKYADWLVDLDTLGDDDDRALFMHCLPLRRNVVATDAVLDCQSSVVVDQAENRFHVQRAVLNHLFNGDVK